MSGLADLTRATVDVSTLAAGGLRGLVALLGFRSEHCGVLSHRALVLWSGEDAHCVWPFVQRAVYGLTGVGPAVPISTVI